MSRSSGSGSDFRSALSQSRILLRDFEYRLWRGAFDFSLGGDLSGNVADNIILEPGMDLRRKYACHKVLRNFPAIPNAVPSPSVRSPAEGS